MTQQIPEDQKQNSIYTNATAFYHYKHDKKAAKERPVAQILYTKLTRKFQKEFSNELINGAHLKLPYALGSMEVVSKKMPEPKLDVEGNPTNLKVDWKATLDLWKEIYPGVDKKGYKEIKDKQLVYHLNEHTNGYFNCLFWHTFNVTGKNKVLYAMEAVRTFKKQISELSLQGKLFNPLQVNVR